MITNTTRTARERCIGCPLPAGRGSKCGTQGDPRPVAAGSVGLISLRPHRRGFPKAAVIFVDDGLTHSSRLPQVRAATFIGPMTSSRHCESDVTPLDRP